MSATILLSAILFLAAGKDDLPSPKTTAELQAEIRKVLDKSKTNGIALALANRDGVSLNWSFGKGETGAVTDKTRFRIGSVSKSFTALAALKLVEEGKLSLDAKYQDLAPEIPFENPWESTDPVRIVHLLEHTAGFDDFSLTEYAHSDPNPIALRDALLYHPQSRHSRWRPGSRFSYCNSGPPMVAYVVEKITHQKFEDYVQKQFFDPIGMPGATFFEPKSDFAGTYIDGKLEKYWHVLERPAGSINATAGDMGNYVRFFLNRGMGLVQPESIGRMETPHSLLAARNAGMKTGYALHNYTSFTEGFVFHGHNGGVNGGLTEFAYSPELGLGYVFMINSGDGAALQKIAKLVVRFLTRDVKKPAPPLASAPETQPVQGTFWLEPVSPRMELLHAFERILGIARAHAEGGVLTVKPLLGGHARRFFYLGKNQYREAESPAPDLAYVIDDGVEALQSTAFGPTMHRIAAWKAWLQVVCAVGFLLALGLTLVASPLWIYRWLKGRIPTTAIPARLLPLATVIAIVISAFVAQGPGSDFEMLSVMGVPSVWSISFTLLTVVIAVLALLAYFVASKTKHAGFIARMASLFLLIGVGYLGWWGWIGIRSWNY